MKNLTKLWSLALLLTAAMFMVSCEEDEPTIDVDEDGLSVADGIYLTAAGEDPVATMQLSPEQVEADGFGAQERSGFVTGYFYLASGDYNIVQTVDREVASTMGGTIETVNYGTEESPMTYDAIDETTDGGEAFPIEAGLYKIAYDEMTSDVVIFKIENVSLIGDATENGGNNDTPLTGSVDENGGAWSGSDIILRSGWYKFRFNSTWNINRLIDPEGGLGADNGFLMFTNFGGSIDNLEPGNVGGNFDMSSDNAGVYSVEISFTSESGFSFSQNRTGDAPEITFVPEENNWAVVGAATDLGWPANDDCGAGGQDVDMEYTGLESGVYSWSVDVDLAADEFKFRKNDCWNGDIGFAALTISGPDADNFSEANGNLLNGNNGKYRVTLSTSDQGESYSASFELLEDFDEEGPTEFDPNDYQWAVVGAATELGWPSGACGDEGEDVDMSYDGEANGTHTWSVELPLSVEQFKFRPNDCWDDGELNFSNTTLEGSAAGNFSNPDNGNISCDVAATYSIVLTTSDDGASYVANISEVE